MQPCACGASSVGVRCCAVGYGVVVHGRAAGAAVMIGVDTSLYVVPLVLGFAAFALAMVLRFAMKGQRFLTLGLVTGIVGRKGHGKSLLLVHEMLRTAGRWQTCPICCAATGEKVRHQVHVASNNMVRLPAKYQPFFRLLDSSLEGEAWWQQLRGLPHLTLVVIDELGQRAPASTGFVLPKEARFYLAQCRKFGHEFMWCSQHESRVTAGVKAQTDLMGYCSRGYFRSMAVRFCEPEDIDRLRKRSATKFRPLMTYRYRVSKRLGDAYDTFALIDADALQGSDLVSVPVGALHDPG